jgi:ribonuclease VapC
VIVDSSALLAILFAEPDAQRFAAAIEAARSRRVSAANWLETAIRVDQASSALASAAFDDLVREADLVVEPVSERQVQIARTAYRAYGKGTGHPAGLNFGDCFAYALAKWRGEPLLFKGSDFDRTDVRSALPSKSIGETGDIHEP